MPNCLSEDSVGRRILVTGGAGFIGSNFIEMMLDRDPSLEVTNLDSLTYAGVAATVAKLDESPRHRFVRGDIRDAALLEDVVAGHDAIVHFAAESHVDRSIAGPAPFLDTNVVGTGVLLDAALTAGVQRFIHVSTDEVYGSIAEGFADEDTVLDPSSPYSASKAASDLLARAYFVTHGMDVVITRCTNNYGPRQFPEKVIPLFVTNLLEGLHVPLYGDGRNERDWLYVEDHCAAIAMLMDDGVAGEIYNIGADNQRTNLELTEFILRATGNDESSIDYVEDRLGHDLRYAVDSSKIRAMGWKPDVAFDEGLTRTIDWYRNNEQWWRPLKEQR